MTYAIILMTISNPESLAAYREKAGDALKKHGGTLAAAAPSPTILEGDIAQPDMAGVLEFPDREAALAWINDPELTETHALRNGAGKSNIVLVG